jgi:tetratricopeptide (TPR) repeat protein
MCAWAIPASAQVIGMPVIRAPWQNPRTSTPMRLQSLRVDVKVVGHVATTTWDLTVFNAQKAVLEGELVFPLGDGQTVSRFAMDVNGALREGVVVEKEKGRQVFEDIVRRGIDPGLLEKTSGNSFRARVYPIPAGGSKRVLIAYEQELSDAGKGSAAGLLYHLPLAFTDTVETFTLRVEVLDQADTPKVQSSPLSTFAFTSWQRAFVAEETQRDIVPNKALTFVVPKGEDARGAFVATDRGEKYFYVTVSPRASRQPKVLPKRLLIVWDASSSARLRDRKKELELLDSYVQKLGGATITLAVLRNELEPTHSGSWAEMRKLIDAAPLDGATNFGALDLAKEAADEVLVFSDGMGTFGAGEPVWPKCPVVAVNSALAADHNWLRGVSESNRGEYINLATQTVADALKALTTLPLVFMRASFDSTQVSDIYPSRAAAVRGPFGVAGKLRAARAKVTLHFGYGATESYSRSFDLDAATEFKAPVSRLWAQKKLAELEQSPASNAKAILALGRQFSIVTDGTSLIVLDTVADYVRYAIEPPADLRAEYDRLVKAAGLQKARTGKDHLEKVVAQFNDRKLWWSTEFKPEPFSDKPQAGAVNESVAVTAESRTDHMVVAQPLAAGPPPPRAMRVQAASAGAGAKSATDGEAPALAGSIELKAWSPDTPYLKALKAEAKAQRYALYLKLRGEYGTTPGFFLDASDVFRDQGDAALALRILTNLAELKTDDPTLLRVLGYRLRQLKLARLAVWTFEQVLALRGDEPQSHRDLALALADTGETQKAVDLCWSVITRPWDERFRDLNLIVVGEMNAIIATAKTRPDTSQIDSRLLQNLPVDIRAVLNWDTPNSDMDLHIIDPRGEECFYSHKQTGIGGRLSWDVTTGYGPEEFLLKKAVAGQYTVRAKFFGTGQQTAIGATTVVLELYLRYATGQVENKSITLRLDGPGRMVDVGTFTIDKREK